MENKIPFLNQKIKQEINADFIGHTVKKESKDEQEVHISAERENKMTHSTSSLPIQDSLLSCEECQQECNGDCHKYEPASPDANIEADCDNSHTKVEIMHTNYSEMPESKQHLGSFGYEKDTHSCPLSNISVFDKHMTTIDRNEHWHASEDHMRLRLSDTKSLVNFVYSQERTVNVSGNQNCNTPPSVKHETCNINCSKTFSVSEINVQVSKSGRAVATDSNLSNQTHKKKEKPYKCDICGASFTRTGNLQVHKRVHTEEKPYKCDVCDAAFTHRCSLKQHNRLHTGEKPYKCGVCGAAFTMTYNLKVHKRVHTGERPYKCDVCGVAFTQRGSLKQHSTLHTGEKNFKCEFCGAAFAYSGHLQAHKRIHTGEKPYNCDVCGVAFTQRSSLKRHSTLQHTGNRHFKCDDCDAAFTNSVYLQKHKRMHTGKKSSSYTLRHLLEYLQRKQFFQE